MEWRLTIKSKLNSFGKNLATPEITKTIRRGHRVFLQNPLQYLCQFFVGEGREKDY